MKAILCGLLINIALIGLGQEKVTSITAQQLEEYIFDATHDLTVFNFWATWCGPCIEELPYFDSLQSKFPNVKVFLVSVDFPSELEKVKTFADNKHIKSSILFMKEKDAENYMKLIDASWSGAIPATLFLQKSGKTYFHEGEFANEQLIKTIKSYLN